jgi:rhomboid protease GluP
MDLQAFLALSAASISAVMIGQLIIVESYRLPGSTRIFAMHGAVILVAALGYRFMPEFYGYPPAFVLAAIFAPGIFAARANREFLAGRNSRAALFARLAFLSHPTATMGFDARLFAALAQSTRPTRIDALECLREKAGVDRAGILELQILRQKKDWQGIIDYLRRTPVPLIGDALSFPIRALGETGQLDAMVQVYSRHRQTLGLTQLPTLTLLAFCGRVDATDSLLASNRIFPPPIRAFWQATALQAAGRGEFAQPLLASFEGGSLTSAQQDILASRLDRPAVEAASKLSPYASNFVDTLEARVRRNAGLRQATWRSTPLTYLLILANCIMFGVEWFCGDTMNAENLFDLGGLSAPAVTQDHEWWRLGTALFLHAGPEHLLSNMLALWVLGRFVESAMGSRRTALIYGLGGLISMAGVVGLMQEGFIEPDLLVGASGAIFALLGAMALARLNDFLASRHIADRRNLMLIALVLGIEAVIDLVLPQVSFSAHAIGFAAGVVLGWLLTPRA